VAPVSDLGHRADPAGRRAGDLLAD
jgi:hypothetical protein